jgi:hypothetical protein
MLILRRCSLSATKAGTVIRAGGLDIAERFERIAGQVRCYFCGT